MNNVTISGRLTKDPECKELNGGKVVCEFVIANNGYRKDDTMFVKVKAWDKRAKSCSDHCKKGTLVNIMGPLRENSWKNKEGHTIREKYILASDIEFVSRPEKSERDSNQSSQSVTQEVKDNTSSEVVEPTQEEMDSVPF
jgi:single-strand DNA-binding protein